jgi:hypothetical protein
VQPFRAVRRQPIRAAPRNVHKLKSRRLAVVIIEEAPDSFAFSHESRRCGDNFDGFEKAIIEPLMVPLPMIMGYELSDRVSQHILTEENHRAIVRQMSDRNAEVKSFFTGYETANAIFDVEQIAACYADVFMFGGPEGV